jgi:hypothetical protein
VGQDEDGDDRQIVPTSSSDAAAMKGQKHATQSGPRQVYAAVEGGVGARSCLSTHKQAPAVGFAHTARFENAQFSPLLRRLV